MSAEKVGLHLRRGLSFATTDTPEFQAPVAEFTAEFTTFSTLMLRVAGTGSSAIGVVKIVGGQHAAFQVSKA